MVSEEFKYRGHQVSVAVSGNEGIDVLKKESFDLIISDFKMPNGNGIILLNYVNSLSQKPLFFFISGHADLSAEECIKAGAKDFFSKPFDLKYLISEVESFFT